MLSNRTRLCGVVAALVALLIVIAPAESRALAEKDSPEQSFGVRHNAHRLNLMHPDDGAFWLQFAALVDEGARADIDAWFSAISEQIEAARPEPGTGAASIPYPSLGPTSIHLAPAGTNTGMGAVTEAYPSGWEPGSINGFPCGQPLPPCFVMARESGGNPTAENPVSSASGLWQFIDSTWDGFGGYAHASWAPVDVQNEKARLTWAGGAGCGHWGACG